MILKYRRYNKLLQQAGFKTIPSDIVICTINYLRAKTISDIFVQSFIFLSELDLLLSPLVRFTHSLELTSSLLLHEHARNTPND